MLNSDVQLNMNGLNYVPVIEYILLRLFDTMINNPVTDNNSNNVLSPDIIHTNHPIGHYPGVAGLASCPWIFPHLL